MLKLALLICSYKIIAILVMCEKKKKKTAGEKYAVIFLSLKERIS